MKSSGDEKSREVSDELGFLLGFFLPYEAYCPSFIVFKN